MTDEIADGYWQEAAERNALRTGTKEQRLEYQTRVFPVEESLATRIDDTDATLLDDLVSIAEGAPDDEARALFGAGILWEFLYNTPDKHAEAIARACERSDAFRDAIKAAFAGWDGLGPQAKHHLKPVVDA